MAPTVWKYHGLGNDFLIVEDAQVVQDQATVARICDRNRGVGADGILYLQLADQPRMTIYNRDGSRPQMCGNGVRCAARWLVEHHQYPEKLTILTDAGPRSCEVQGAMVQVEMGLATHSRQPTSKEFRSGVSVDMGNPHIVLFKNTPLTDHLLELDVLGKSANAAHTDFKEGVNVEFAVQTGPRRFEVAVYERGVGRTMACGTGACAVAFAAISHGLVDPDTEVEIVLAGGPLRVYIDASSQVLMTGPAEFVFTGSLSTNLLTSTATTLA